MSQPFYSTKQVAQMLDVSTHTVKGWRDPSYENSPLYLVGETYRHNGYHYPHDALMAWIRRNPKYRDKLLASFAPESAFNTFLPLSRNRATPAASTDWHNVATTTP